MLRRVTGCEPSRQQVERAVAHERMESAADAADASTAAVVLDARHRRANLRREARRASVLRRADEQRAGNAERRRRAVEGLRAGGAGLVSGRIPHQRLGRWRNHWTLEPIERRPWAARLTMLPGMLTLHRHPFAVYGFKRGAAGGGGRGEVRGMSRDSRSRLLRTLAAINWREYGAKTKRASRARGVFVTLTYPDSALPAETAVLQDGETEIQWIDRGRVKRDLDAMGKWISRRPGFRGCVWRMEIEARKSGERRGAWCPHFHLVCLFDREHRLGRGVAVADERPVARDRMLRAQVAQAWARIVGAADPRHAAIGTAVDSIWSGRGGEGGGKLMQYLVKYMSKGGEIEFVGKGGELFRPETGRVWGVIGKLPQVEPMVISIENRLAWNAIFRRLRRWGAKSRYLSGVSSWAITVNVYCDGCRVADIVTAGIEDIGVPEPDCIDDILEAVSYAQT